MPQDLPLPSLGAMEAEVGVSDAIHCPNLLQTQKPTHMKKTLLGFGTGFLAAFLLVSAYAFQTESDADVVIMRHALDGLDIAHGNGETRELDIELPPMGRGTKRGLERQTAFAKVLQEYSKQGYRVKTAMMVSGAYQYILTKD